MQSVSQDRQPAVAGQFYPGSSKKLLSELEQYFSQARAPVKPGIKPLAVISPHAGYVYSAKVAASAFTQIPEKAKYDRVFLIGSSHRYSFGGGAVFTRGDYLTPLGPVRVDKELGEELMNAESRFFQHDDAHLFEHSLEVQLPFLQQRLHPDFRLVPIVLGPHSHEDCRIIAESLSRWFSPENLFVISTDFSHYPDYDSAVSVDRSTAEAIASNNPEKLLLVLDTNKKAQIRGLATSLCGWTSVLTLLYMTMNKHVEFCLVDYQNSGDQPVYGDRFRVVGYEAIAVFPGRTEFDLSEEDKKALIRIARESITRELVHSAKTGREEPETGNLSQKAGAFVSIYCKGELRGCIGSFKSDSAVAEVVRKMAASATHDNRFKSLDKEDIFDIRIEISVLTPLKKIRNPEEIVIGRHGIYIRKGFYSGTFLPQVATSRNWTVEEFLGRCSRDKAGLGWDGWKNAELFTYEAIIINEEQDSAD